MLLSLERRPETQSLQQQIRAAEERAEAAEAEGRPLLRALGSVGYLNAPAEFGDNRIYAVGLSFSYPLFTGGQVQAEVASARHQRAALQAARDELTQTIRLQVTKASLGLDALVRNRHAAAEQLRQARDSVTLASRRYREGLGDFLELQQAQLGFLNAEINAVRLRYDLVTAQAALHFAQGTLHFAQGTLAGVDPPEGH